jgi:hypothetical protein
LYYDPDEEKIVATGHSSSKNAILGVIYEYSPNMTLKYTLKLNDKKLIASTKGYKSGSVYSIGTETNPLTQTFQSNLYYYKTIVVLDSKNENRLLAIHKPNDNIFVVGGSTINEETKGDAYIARIDEPYKMSWKKTFSYEGWDEITNINSDYDDILVAAGYKYTPPSKSTSGWIVKINKDMGYVQREWEFSLPDHDVYFLNVQCIDDNSLLISGYTVAKNSKQEKGIIARFKDGQFISYKILDNIKRVYASCYIPFKGFYACGYSQKETATLIHFTTDDEEKIKQLYASALSSLNQSFYNTALHYTNEALKIRPFSESLSALKEKIQEKKENAEKLEKRRRDSLLYVQKKRKQDSIMEIERIKKRIYDSIAATMSKPAETEGAGNHQQHALKKQT